MSNTLRLLFKAQSGKNILITYPDAEVTATGLQVRTLMQRLVTNGDLFVDPPVERLEAKFAIMTLIPIDIG